MVSKGLTRCLVENSLVRADCGLVSFKPFFLVFWRVCSHSTNKSFSIFSQRPGPWRFLRFWVVLTLLLFMGVGRKGAGGVIHPCILKCLAKKVIFLVSRRKKQILPLLPPPKKNLKKSPNALPWIKSFRRPCSSSFLMFRQCKYVPLHSPPCELHTAVYLAQNPYTTSFVHNSYDDFRVLRG